jgi:hypothetical protein
MPSTAYYYQILGLKPNASKQAVKSAYRKLAMRYHPDKKGGSQAKFIEIQKAYEVLLGLTETKKKHPEYSVFEMQQMYEQLQKLAQERAKDRQKAYAAKKRKLKEEEQAKEYAKALRGLGAVILIAITAYYGYNWYFNLMINRDKFTTTAKVVALERKRVIYQFFTANGSRKEKAYVSNVGLEMLAENGLPLKVGDNFTIAYSAQNPDYNSLKYNKVSRETLVRYLNLCEKPIQEIFKVEWQGLSANEKRLSAQCIALVVYQKLGLEGLAQLYYYQAHPLENLSNNSITWYFFKSKPVFKEIQSLCKRTTLSGLKF